jgi:hypothetical protein
MKLIGARRRPWNRRHAGRGGYLRYTTAYPGTRARLRPSRLAATRAADGTWWRRLMDDRDLTGAKLLLLAAVLGVTALLERIV